MCIVLPFDGNGPFGAVTHLAFKMGVKACCGVDTDAKNI